MFDKYFYWIVELEWTSLEDILFTKFYYALYMLVHLSILCVIIMQITSAVPTLKKRFVGARETFGLTDSPSSIVHLASLSLLELLAKTISMSLW